MIDEPPQAPYAPPRHPNLTWVVVGVLVVGVLVMVLLGRTHPSPTEPPSPVTTLPVK